MNAIRIDNHIINLDQVVYMVCGEYEGKPSIDFVIPTVAAAAESKQADPTKLDTLPLWFNKEKDRDTVFEHLCDKVGAIDIPKRIL